jgi:hypothetical protein
MQSGSSTEHWEKWTGEQASQLEAELVILALDLNQEERYAKFRPLRFSLEKKTKGNEPIKYYLVIALSSAALKKQISINNPLHHQKLRQLLSESEPLLDQLNKLKNQYKNSILTLSITENIDGKCEVTFTTPNINGEVIEMLSPLIDINHENSAALISSYTEDFLSNTLDGISLGFKKIGDYAGAKTTLTPLLKMLLTDKNYFKLFSEKKLSPDDFIGFNADQIKFLLQDRIPAMIATGIITLQEIHQLQPQDLEYFTQKLATNVKDLSARLRMVVTIRQAEKDNKTPTESLTDITTMLDKHQGLLKLITLTMSNEQGYKRLKNPNMLAEAEKIGRENSLLVHLFLLGYITAEQVDSIKEVFTTSTNTIDLSQIREGEIDKNIMINEILPKVITFLVPLAKAGLIDANELLYKILTDEKIRLAVMKTTTNKIPPELLSAVRQSAFNTLQNILDKRDYIGNIGNAEIGKLIDNCNQYGLTKELDQIVKHLMIIYIKEVRSEITKGPINEPKTQTSKEDSNDGWGDNDFEVDEDQQGDWDKLSADDDQDKITSIDMQDSITALLLAKQDIANIPPLHQKFFALVEGIEILQKLSLEKNNKEGVASTLKTIDTLIERFNSQLERQEFGTSSSSTKTPQHFQRAPDKLILSDNILEGILPYLSNLRKKQTFGKS